MSEPKSIDLGGVQITVVSGGVNWMDGGTMLGILPRMIWENWYPPDGENRIRLETHCLVVETNSEVILIESGCGDKLAAQERDFYGASLGDWIGPNLEAAGFSPTSIHRVALTHLHTDHAGGVVAYDENEKLVPTFPNAQVYVGQQEFEDAESGYGITPNAYDPKNYRPLLDAGALKISPSESKITENLYSLSTPGHTRGHQSILIKGEERSLLFTGDLLPLARQVVPHFNMAFEVDPVLKTETKRRVLERAHEENWILVLSHEPETPMCEVKYDSARRRYELVPIE